MKSGTSSFESRGWFNATLLKKNLTRFWPLWAIYAFVLFLSLDMPIIRMSTWMAWPYGVSAETIPGEGLRLALAQRLVYYVQSAMEVGVFLGLIFGCLLAMALFSYLMNRRSVGMIHALPIKREGLFFTNWLSGVIFITGPSLVVFLIALFAELGKGVGLAGLEDLGLWLLVNVSVTLFFFEFALFCAMFTGQLLALPVFYGILNALVLGMYYLLLMGLQVLVVGVSTYGSVPALVRWCTPVAHLVELVADWEGIELPNGMWVQTITSGSLQASAYAILVGAVFLLIAFWVYRFRQMERAEDLVTVSWVRPVFRYGVGVCTGFALGTFLYENYFTHWGAWGYIFLVTLCAVIGGFVGQMFLRKTLRVLASGWKGSLALGMCMLLLLCGIRMDFFGIQRYVPQADRVASVSLSGIRTYPSDGGGYTSLKLDDPALIGRVVELHQGIVDRLEEVDRAGSRNYSSGSGSYWESGERETVRFRVTYTLADGREVSREYNTVPVVRADLADPDSWTSQMVAFLEEPAVQWNNYLPWESRAEDLAAVGGKLWFPREGNAWEQDYERTRELEYEEAQLLWTAIREDMAAGRYHRYLFQDEDYTANVTGWEIYLDLYGKMGMGANAQNTSTGISVQVQRSATATIAAMEKLGYVDPQLVADKK